MAMTATADSLAGSGSAQPPSTRNSTLHGEESVLKEKVDAKVASVEEVRDAQADDFPDGGLRAWLVVGGV